MEKYQRLERFFELCSNISLIVMAALLFHIICNFKQMNNDIPFALKEMGCFSMLLGIVGSIGEIYCVIKMLR